MNFSKESKNCRDAARLFSVPKKSKDRLNRTRLTNWTRSLGGFLACLALIIVVQPAAAQNPATTSIALAWDPSPSPDVVGYVIYYGAESGNYTNSLPVGNETSASISGLLVGVTYYFALTALNADGMESGFSNEISYQPELSGAQLQIHSAGNGQFTLTVNGPGGHTFAIEATQDFSTWTVLGTLTLDAGGSSDFTDLNAADFPQRFYRTREIEP